MNRHSFRRLSAGVGAGIASVAVASVALAAPVPISWSDPVDLRMKVGVGLQDAAFAGRRVAVVWGEGPADHPTVRVRTSTDAGATWSRTTVFDNAEGAAVAICGDEVEVALSRRVRPGVRVIDVAFGDVGGGAFGIARVAGGRGFRWNPDVACTDGRLFVSWYRREGGPTRRLVAHALLATHEFGEAKDLGLDWTNYDGYFAPIGFRIAASGDTAYAVFGAADGRMRLKRWSVGDGPAHRVTARVTQLIGRGNEECPAGYPVIDANGESVAVGWERNATILTRISSDRGLSWRIARALDDPGEDICDWIVEGGSVLLAMAVRGARMAVTRASCGFESCTLIVNRTRDGFEHSALIVLGDDQVHIAGFVIVGQQVRLADAFSGARRVRFRHAF